MRISRLRPPRSSGLSDCSGGVFDWDIALRRLDELNARVEDPTLWNNPEQAQALSRERTRLADQVEAVRVIERERADAIEFAEMAEAEGDEASLNETAAQNGQGAPSWKPCCRARPTPTTPMSKSIPGPGAPSPATGR